MKRCVVQEDWETALAEGQGFWLSLRPTSTSSGVLPKHFSVKPSGGDSLTAEEGVSITKTSTTSLAVTYETTTMPVFAPKHTHRKLHARGEVGADIAYRGAFGVSGGVSGSLVVWDGATGSEKQRLEGHVGDVYGARFFPSGQVVLSYGADTTLRIWNVSDGWCGAILKGHQGGVFGCDFIDQGRNLVSCSRDGSVKLWDCASQSCIHSFPVSTKPINACAVVPLESGNKGTVEGDPREAGTMGNAVVCGGEDGTLMVFDLRSRDKIAAHSLGASITAITCVGGSLVAGTECGSLYTLSPAQLTCPSVSIQPTMDMSTSAISSLCGAGEGGVWCGARDGSCGRVSLASGQVTAELSGVSLEPVSSVQVAGDSVVMGTRDGYVRMYKVDP